MKRREFITLLGGTAVAWPLAARAQQQVRPVVGFLNPGSRADFGHHAEAFLKGLKESGFIEGENITVEYRWAEGRYERLPQHAEELVKLRVAVIAVGSPPATFAAKSARGTRRASRYEGTKSAHRRRSSCSSTVKGRSRRSVFSALSPGGR
jgi:putative ABC transport system substrate-binding protein